jgi:carbonic anhydrase
MPESYRSLLEGNRQFVEEQLKADPEFFNKLSTHQDPDFLWIGCSDSRVPANQITNTIPGDIFVHRNIANLVVHTDINMLSVLHYAVEILKVKHVIVCGHYGCGGVLAAMSNRSYGLIDNWLRNIKDVYRMHKVELDAIHDLDVRNRRLVELTVIEQVYNLSKTSVIQDAWKKNNLPVLHGWVYGLEDGKIRNLHVTARDNSMMEQIYRFD